MYSNERIKYRLLYIYILLYNDIIRRVKKMRYLNLLDNITNHHKLTSKSKQ